MCIHCSPCLCQLRHAEDEATLKNALEAMNTELRRILAIDWLGQILLREVRNLGNGTSPWCKVIVWDQYMGRMSQAHPDAVTFSFRINEPSSPSYPHHKWTEKGSKNEQVGDHGKITRKKTILKQEKNKESSCCCLGYKLSLLGVCCQN